MEKCHERTPPPKFFSVSRRSIIPAAGNAAASFCLPVHNALADVQSVQLNQTVTTDEYEYTLTNCEWSDAVYPPNTASAYNYFQGESGKHYFIVNGTFKNLAGYSYLLSNQTKVSFQFNDKYQYDGIVYTAVDHSTHVDQYEATDPLEVVNVYICSLVPDEIMETFDSVQIDWAFYNLASNVYVSPDTIPVQTYCLSCTSEDIQDGETTDEEPAQIGDTTETPSFLSLNGIKLELWDSLYAFQLEGQTGWAWAADGSGSICMSARENEDVPTKDSELDAFFAGRVQAYADSQGWNVTRSERIELSDGLEGFLNTADHGDGSSTSFIDILTGDNEFVQIDIVETASAGAIDTYGAQDSTSPYKDGEYVAAGKGIGGVVPVTVTISNGGISDVAVGDNNETQGIGSKAVDQLPAAIAASGGTDGVDAITGATVTSKAIFAAVNDCLDQAAAAQNEPAPTPDDTGDIPSLLDRVAQSITAEQADEMNLAIDGTESYSAAGIALDHPACNEQKMAFDTLYLFDDERTLQTYVESYGGPQKEITSVYDEASMWSNLFAYTGGYDVSAPEWPSDYAQQFAISRNGWILSSGTVEIGTSVASLFAIRGETEIGSAIYTVAIIPQDSGRPTVVTTRCPLGAAKRWITAINNMVASIATIEPNDTWSWQLSTQPGWQILAPGGFTLSNQKIEVYTYLNYWVAESDCLGILQAELVAKYNTYYPFGVAGDKLSDGLYATNQWDAEMPGASIRFTEAHTYDNPDEIWLVVDIHSGTNNCFYMQFIMLHQADREFVMPTITTVCASIAFTN